MKSAAQRAGGHAVADLPFVERARWSREELRELVTGKVVFFRDRAAIDLPIPDWLAEAADDVWHEEAGASIEAAHPGDRMAIIESFLAALEHPGELCAARLREYINGEWFHIELTWLNQLGNPDIGALIGTRLVLSTATGPTPDAVEAHYSRFTGWVLLELDETGFIGSARGQVEAIFGMCPEKLVGQALVGLVHPDSVAETVTDWTGLMTDPTRTQVAPPQ
jgi:hypothetical protein